MHKHTQRFYSLYMTVIISAYMIYLHISCIFVINHWSHSATLTPRSCNCSRGCGVALQATTNALLLFHVEKKKNILKKYNNNLDLIEDEYIYEKDSFIKYFYKMRREAIFFYICRLHHDDNNVCYVRQYQYRFQLFGKCVQLFWKRLAKGWLDCESYAQYSELKQGAA